MILTHTREQRTFEFQLIFKLVRLLILVTEKKYVYKYF